jgi:ADP-glucose pyrophosphorylase
VKNIFLVIILLTVFSCGESENKPDKLLPKGKMVEMLIDIHILESKIQNLRLKKDSSQLLFNSFEREVFKNNNVDKEVYLRSFEYYLNDVDAMEEIYEVVIDSLNFLEKALKEKIEMSEEEMEGEFK